MFSNWQTTEDKMSVCEQSGSISLAKHLDHGKSEILTGKASQKVETLDLCQTRGKIERKRAIEEGRKEKESDRAEKERERHKRERERYERERERHERERERIPSSYSLCHERFPLPDCPYSHLSAYLRLCSVFLCDLQDDHEISRISFFSFFHTSTRIYITFSSDLAYKILF